MDGYAQHLATVNEVQNVVASEDIFNAQGQVIVKQGTKINRGTAEQVAKFKLLKPLEESIAIEDELDAEMLVACFDYFLSHDPYLNATYADHKYLPRLIDCCEFLCSFPLLRQKVTVVSAVMPNVFEQAMFCAWFSLLLKDRLPDEIGGEKYMFVAAMCHDIGMVHINEEILKKSERLSDEEWRQIQAHPVIGYNIVKSVMGLKNCAARAILEHHENLDGTGYPRDLGGSQLCTEGQILNLLDSVNAIYVKRFKPAGRSLADISPIIQMNRHSRFGSVGNQFIMLLKRIPASKSHSIPAGLAKDVIQAVKAVDGYICRCMDLTNEIADAIGFNKIEDNKLATVQNAIIHVNMSVSQSGIVNEAYMRWLDCVADEELEHAYKEVEEAYLMMQEILYHLDKLCLLMRFYVIKTPNTKVSKLLSNGVSLLERIPKPPIDKKLTGIWMFSF